MILLVLGWNWLRTLVMIDTIPPYSHLGGLRVVVVHGFRKHIHPGVVGFELTTRTLIENLYEEGQEFR